MLRNNLSKECPLNIQILQIIDSFPSMGIFISKLACVKTVEIVGPLYVATKNTSFKHKNDYRITLALNNRDPIYPYN